MAFEMVKINLIFSRSKLYYLTMSICMLEMERRIFDVGPEDKRQHIFHKRTGGKSVDTGFAFVQQRSGRRSHISAECRGLL